MLPDMKLKNLIIIPWCHSNIKHADMFGRLHGHKWADHALHECTHPGFTKARETVRTKYAAELSKRVPANKSIPNVNVRSLTATPATNLAARLPAGDQSNNENDILLDLRGYVQTDMPALAKRVGLSQHCLLYTSPSPRDATLSRMPSSA